MVIGEVFHSLSGGVKALHVVCDDGVFCLMINHHRGFAEHTYPVLDMGPPVSLGTGPTPGKIPGDYEVALTRDENKITRVACVSTSASNFNSKQCRK